MKIRIGNKLIGEEDPCFIIAEAGVNHNGDFKLAKEMIDAAKVAGADAIKFQTFKTEWLVTKTAPKAPYQMRCNRQEKTQYGMLKKLELSEEQFAELFKYCKRKKIIFLSTPFDFKSAQFLYELGVSAFKVSSGEITNIPFLIKISQYNRPMILSTGMSTLKEVKEAVKAIYLAGNKKLILLHCTSNYPTRYENVNLRAINTMRNEFKIPIGYSDHTLGIEVSLAAVALGASVIEKHFTLSRNMKGPDHAISIEPEELRKLVEGIKIIGKSLGTSEKKPMASEKEMIQNIRKSIVANDDIKEGTKVTFSKLSFKRPGYGLSPKFVSKLIGKTAKQDIKKDELITLEKLYK